VSYSLGRITKKFFSPGKFDSFTFESSSRETFRVILKNDFGFKILFVKFLFLGFLKVIFCDFWRGDAMDWNCGFLSD
jgi:hypothetical protein